MSKLYTKNGDTGITNLYDKKRMPKNNFFFEVLGDIDELSSFIGFVCVETEKTAAHTATKQLRKIQSKLLDIGSDIATTSNRDKVVCILFEDVNEIEILIDTYDSEAPKLTEFILPGFSEIDSRLHICRSVCRRLERHLWELYHLCREQNTPLQIGSEVFAYLNRLSDYFFAMARVFSGGKECTRSQINKQK